MDHVLKPYVAPTVTVVHLTPEEVSLGSCKTDDNSCALAGMNYGS